jgi:hypothetical protein
MRQPVGVCWAICAKQWTFIKQVRNTLFKMMDLLMTILNIVIDADPTHNEAKMKLAELYEIMDEPRKALDLVYQGN